MKKSIFILFIGALMVMSCQNDNEFLTRLPKTTITDDNFFVDEEHLLMAYYSIYQNLEGANYCWEYKNVIEALNDDNFEEVEGDPFDQFTFTPDDGLITDVWKMWYWGIHKCNFVLDRIDDKNIKFKSEETRARLKAETKVIRGLYYSYLAFIWGDVPYMNKVMPNSEILTMIKTPKSEVLKNICIDLNEAMPFLYSRNEQPASEYGRPTKGLALALLSRCYLNNENFSENGKDNWQLAAEVLKALIDSKEYSLIQLPSTIANPSNRDYTNMYMSVFMEEPYPSTHPTGGNFNKESIFEKVYTKFVASQYGEWSWFGTNSNTSMRQQAFGLSQLGGWRKSNPTQSIVNEYDGRFKITDDFFTKAAKNISATDVDIFKSKFLGKEFSNRQQVVDALVEVFGWKLGNKYKHLVYGYAVVDEDPRLRASIWIHGDTTFYPSNPKALYDGIGTMPTGYTPKKGLFPPEINLMQTSNNLILFRYADVLLMYAEAVAHTGSDDPTKYLDMIRKRVGLSSAQEEMKAKGIDVKQLIMAERRREMYFEDTRYWDLRRWKMAGWIPNIADFYRIPDANGNILTPFVENKHDYLPIPKDEIDRTSGITQNPNYGN